MSETPLSPFKFLDPYLKGDQDQFFGRETEIEDLYTLVTRHKFVIVYGKIGTGKTSLIRCGLANCFEESDWFSLYIRRGNNLIESIECALKSHGISLKGRDSESIKAGISELIRSKLRPVYIIYDQFEELLILGSEEEKLEALEVLKAIYCEEALASCNQIISIREEFFGALELFFKDIPQVLDARLLLRPMDSEKVREVIISSGPRHNITYEKGAVDRMLGILQDQSDISLPYLQVYMDQLWKKDFERTYPNGYSGDLGHPYLQWTIEEIDESGKLKDVLQRFLREQSAVISAELDAFMLDHLGSKPEMQDATDVLDTILDCMVTKEGTKHPLEIIPGTDTRLGASAPEVLLRLDQELLSRAIELLELHRIIRKENGYVELAHDKLAELIYQKRAQLIGQQADLQVLIEQVKDTSTGTSHLSESEINRFEQISGKLDKESRDFIADSKRFNRKSYLLKFGTLVAVPLLIIIAYIGCQNNTLRNREGQLFASIYFSNGFDTISNKKLALNIASYLYHRQSPDEHPDPLLPAYLKLYEHKNVQSMFSYGVINVPVDEVQEGDFDISDNGRFVVCRNDTSGNYRLYSSKGDILTRFSKVAYSYFIYDTNLLVIVKQMSGMNRLQANLSNHIEIYNCETMQLTNTLKIDEGYLYTKQALSTSDLNRNDSFRVRYDANGNLLVPYYKESKQYDSSFGNLRIIYPDNKSVDIRTDYTISNSADLKWLMTGYMGRVEIRNVENPLYTTHKFIGSSFWDLIGNDHAIFITRDSIRYTDVKGNLVYSLANTLKAYQLKSDGKFAVGKNPANQYAFYNLKTGASRSLTEKLEAIDFGTQYLLLSHSGRHDLSAPTLISQRFDLKAADSLKLDSAIIQTSYNTASKTLLVLLKGYKLLLLDQKLKIKASYRITKDDLFGFSQNGKYLYYIRDNTINLIENKKEMVNIASLSSAEQWLRGLKGKPGDQVTSEVLSQYNLPGRLIF